MTMAVTMNVDPAPVRLGPGPDGNPPAHITVRGLHKQFSDTVIYENFDLDIPRGKFISIFGPNGCGKSTLINLISGLIPIDSGDVRFGGKTLAETKIGYVFQNYREALFPWMTAFENIVYALLPGTFTDFIDHVSGRQDRPETLPLYDVGRTAAAGLDHARPYHRTRSPVPRRAVLGARL